MTGFFQVLAARLESSQRVFVGLVVGHTPHSPGSTGARMAVFEDGESIGTVGGGVMELSISAMASAALNNSADPFVPRLRHLVHRIDAGDAASGLMCAGEQTNLYLLLDRTDHLAPLQAAAEAERLGLPGVLTISPAALTFRPDDAGPQHRLLQNAGTWEYRQQLLNLSRVAVLGGGHCGLALSRTLASLGYHVSVFDDRASVPTMDANTMADTSRVVDDLTAAASLVDYPDLTAAVVMCNDVKNDIRALSGLLRLPFPFIGVMGSPAKIGHISSSLRDAGFGKADLRRLTAPVGLPIGSRTPQEIAISVAAQLIERERAL
ncbi:MAG: xanthine dehydrogenase accessory factor [Rhodothermales bacterium]|jgi:xanthine dehydrogenase accessory factor